MAVSFSRNKVASRTVALVVCVLLLFLLGGCAATPKTAATRFNSFAQATTTLGTQVVSAYVLDDTIVKKARTLEFINNYTTNSSVFLVRPTVLPAKTLSTRQTLVLGLATYANALKDIMNDEPLTTVAEKAAVIGKELESIQSAIASTALAQLPTDVSPAAIGNAVGELGKYLMDIKRQAYLKNKIKDMDPQIQTIVAFLKNDLGTCDTVIYGGITLYCTGDSKESLGEIPKEDVTVPSGLGADYCDHFGWNQVQYQTKVNRSGPKPGSSGKSTAATPKASTQFSGDQLKIIEQQAPLTWKAKAACDGLDLLKKCLDEFAVIHAHLPTALEGKSGTLATELAKLTLQLTIVKQQFESATAN